MIYVLYVQTGKETDILRELKRREISAVVPREWLLIRKSGMWSKKIKHLFPGYVFVDIDYSPEMFHKIKPISGVIRFLGNPTPLPAREENTIRWLGNNGDVIEQSYALVDSSGKLIGFEGFLSGAEDRIRYISLRQKKAAVEVTFDGRVHKATLAVEKKPNISEQG